MNEFLRTFSKWTATLAIGVALGGAAHATSDTIRWLKMAPPAFGSSVPSGSVYNVPGVGPVTVTYSMPAVMTNTRLQSTNLANGSLSNGGNNYNWFSHESLATIFTVGPDPLVPLPWTITYTFPNKLPCGSLYLGVVGLGKTTSFGGGKSTVTVNQSGTFLGDWAGGGTYGPTLFGGGSGSFSMENSLSGPGGIDPWWNTPLGVVRIDDSVTSLTVNCSQIRGDGIGINIGFGCMLANDFRAHWLQMNPVPFGTSVPNNSTFFLPGVGNVNVTYSTPAVMSNTRLSVPQFANGTLTNGGKNYAWGGFEDFATIFTVGPDPLVPLPWTITYTFPTKLPCGSILLGVTGLGKTTSFGGGKSTAMCNQNGTFLGDWSGGGLLGPTLFTGGAGTFAMENSLSGAGGADPWWNTALGVVRIDDSISSLTVNMSQIRGDGVGLNIAYLSPTWCDLDRGLTGVNGIPQLQGVGTLQPASLGALNLTKANPSALAVLFISFSSAPTPFVGGTLIPFPVAATVSLVTDATGAIPLPFLWPSGLPSGTSLYFQYAVQDPFGPQGASLSNALRAMTP